MDATNGRSTLPGNSPEARALEAYGKAATLYIEKRAVVEQLEQQTDKARADLVLMERTLLEARTAMDKTLGVGQTKPKRVGVPQTPEAIAKRLETQRRNREAKAQQQALAAEAMG